MSRFELFLIQVIWFAAITGIVVGAVTGFDVDGGLPAADTGRGQPGIATQYAI